MVGPQLATVFDSPPSRTAMSWSDQSSAQARPLDRSHLLRRSAKYPFQNGHGDEDMIRIRRSRRRVSASFSAIPPLARREF